MTCDVCGGEFTPADEDQRRCSDECLEFVRAHKHARRKTLANLWKLHVRYTRPCPSGKVRHQKKRDAEQAARVAVRLRYDPVPDWLRIYECPACHGWHLTSKPGRET